MRLSTSLTNAGRTPRDVEAVERTPREGTSATSRPVRRTGWSAAP